MNLSQSSTSGLSPVESADGHDEDAQRKTPPARREHVFNRLVSQPNSRHDADSLVLKVERRDGTGSWQHVLIKFLLREGFQTFLVSLLVIDVLCVVTELFLEARYPTCYRAREVVEECAFNPDGSAAMGAHRRAGDGEDDHSQISNLISFPPACKHHQEWLGIAHDALRWTSISILFIFIVELFLVLASLRTLFFSSMVYIVDIIVVITSLILDFVLFAKADDLHSSEAAQFATLLICARLWRFIRVGHGIVTATYESMEMQIEEEKEKLHHEIRHLKRKVQELEADSAAPCGITPKAYSLAYTQRESGAGEAARDGGARSHGPEENGAVLRSGHLGTGEWQGQYLSVTPTPMIGQIYEA